MNLRPAIAARSRLTMLLGALLLAGAVLCAAPARGDGQPAAIPPEEYGVYTKALVDGEGPPDWDGVLVDTLLTQVRDTHSALYGGIVGPVFTNEALTAGLAPEARRALFAHVIAHLAQTQPQDDAILLLDAFLPHLAADPALVTLVHDEKLRRDPRTGRRPAWDRLVRNAAALAGDKVPAVRRAAIRLSARRAPGDEAEGVAVLDRALRPVANPIGPEDAQAWLDAFERLVGHRFASIDALRTYLTPFAERLAAFERWTAVDRAEVRADLLRAVNDLLRAEGGTQMEDSRKAARRYGRLLIEKTTEPKGLEVFFDGASEQDPELQRLAMKAARDRLKPVRDDNWASLLARCLAHSTDAQVLGTVIEIAGLLFNEPTPVLAKAVALRLEHPARTDTGQQRRDLAGILGVIGTIDDVRQALPANLQNGNGAQAPVYAALIRAVGLVKDGNVQELVWRYRTSTGDPQPDWARLAVAEALGYKGIRSHEEQASLAASMLQHILSGVAVTLGEPGSPASVSLPEAAPEAVPAVRAAAIDSLQHYAGPATAGLLRQIALKDIRAPDSAEGDTAIKSLGRMLRRKSVDAAGALGALLLALPPEKRLHGLLDLVGTETPADLDAAARGRLGDAVRSVLLAEEASETSRLKAAEVLVRFADPRPETLDLLYRTWTSAEEPEVQARWRDLVRDLLAALAATGPAEDDLLEKHLGTMAAEGRHAEALAFLDAMGESAARYPLKRARADVHYTYATYASATGGRTRAEQREDLDAALRLFQQLVAESPSPATRLDVQRTLFNILQTRAEADWLAASEAAKTFLLRAVEVAVQSENAALAKIASENIVKQLETQALSDQEKATLAQHSKRLREIQGA